MSDNMETLSKFFTQKAMDIAFEHIECMNKNYDINSKDFIYKNFSYFYKMRIEVNLNYENPSILIKGIGISIIDSDDELFMIYQMNDHFVLTDLNMPILNLLKSRDNKFIEIINSLKIQMEAEIDTLIIKLNGYLDEHKDLFMKVNSKMMETTQNLYII
jgi:hypothetical protein